MRFLRLIPTSQYVDISSNLSNLLLILFWGWVALFGPRQNMGSLHSKNKLFYFFQFTKTTVFLRHFLSSPLADIWTLSSWNFTITLIQVPTGRYILWHINISISGVQSGDYNNGTGNLTSEEEGRISSQNPSTAKSVYIVLFLFWLSSHNYYFKFSEELTMESQT